MIPIKEPTVQTVTCTVHGKNDENILKLILYGEISFSRKLTYRDSTKRLKSFN